MNSVLTTALDPASNLAANDWEPMLVGGISEPEMRNLQEIIVRGRRNAVPGGVSNLLESFLGIGTPRHSRLTEEAA